MEKDTVVIGICYDSVMIMIYVSNRHYSVIQLNSLYSLEIL